ncbi:pentatricopeptide repeat-containing protein At2g22070 [Cryptomeria japonica]|uniref:pentatricopeptide repeat-containing protein At2g22070 n=1 Tax=Cryptomeria japonica TaxID=3369 RepID=UPI0027DA3818|nr:pentatricopeptide repeat-containing protein At2g22070 [Cryptomeria japonica]
MHISMFNCDHTMPMPLPLPLPSTAHLNITALFREGRLKEALHFLLTTQNPPVDCSTYLQLLHTCIAKNALSRAYRRHGFPREALKMFYQMQATGVQPNKLSFSSILPACAKVRALEEGMDIHKSIVEGGFLSDVVISTALVDMYAKCGNIHKAREMFDKMPMRNVVSWNAMLSGYAQNGDLEEAFRLFKEMPRPDSISWNAMVAGYAQNGLVEKALEAFKQMQLEGVKPDFKSFTSILPACAKMGALEYGLEIHKSIIESGFLSDIIVVNALIDMYGKCGCMYKARELFQKMMQRDVISWTAIVSGYAQNGFLDEAWILFEEMPHRNVISWNAMITAYAQNGFFDEALRLFKEMPQPDVITWNAMVVGYTQNGFFEKALEMFTEMQMSGLKPNSTTFASILPACAKMGVLEQGIYIHQSIIESGFLSDVVVASALVDMYTKCGSIQKARELFDKISKRDAVSWTAMIAGYAQNGFFEKALETFKQMQLTDVKPDSTTFASILPACAKMGALEQGMDIHRSIIENGLLSDVVVGNTLVDMYAKCGSIQKAHELFHKIPQRNVISWNTMIAGYAQNGFCKDALRIFELIRQSGTYPDHVSFACVLFACSHAGLVDEGCKYFSDMSNCYCIMPAIEHYVCMVDLLSRAGYLEETLNFIIKIPIKPVAVMWMCLLGACKTHKNLGLGAFTATLIFELDPKNTASYVLLSNIYAEVGNWSESLKVRKLMKDGGINKIPGCSWIEGHKMVHVFCAGDRSHPQTQEIYAKLENLSWAMKASGYFPNSRHALNDVEEEEKESFLCHHSEKMAIAFGLLNTPPGATIRIVKNLRVCVECHTATKFISKIVAREIVVRDASRFHHFKQGQCSCGDYW